MLLSFAYTPYIAIIGDIKNSKQLHERHAVQEDLLETLETINQTYQSAIASKFMITLGDEFQGLLKSGACAVAIIDQIERALYPIRLRFGIGVGEVSTEISLASTLSADGPAFYCAREMINTLKALENKNKEGKKNIAIKIQGNEKTAALLNTLFALLSVVKDNWTARRVEIINAYIKENGTQMDAAKTLGIYQSNVQKALAAANFYTYQDALDTIADILSEIKEDADV